MSGLLITVCVPLTDDPTQAILEAVGTGVDTPVEIRYEPSLLPPQRFPADHKGDPTFRRSPAQEQRWQQLLATTDVALGIPGDGPTGLRHLVRVSPTLRWVQATAAGAGEQLGAAGLDDIELARVQVTSAAGLHAWPLAEFALSGLLAMAKDHDLLRSSSAAHQWLPRWPMRQLADSRVAVLGLGGIGRRVAELLGVLGADVTGVRRQVGGGPGAKAPPQHFQGVRRLVPLDHLDALLPEVDALVATLPGTPQTHGLLDARRLGLLPSHAVVVNVGRGNVLDSAALVAALDAGRLRGAVLDVTDVEPLPSGSPLWDRTDVLLSPHTAALTVVEDQRIIALFAENLVRFRRSEPLRNLVDPAAGY